MAERKVQGSNTGWLTAAVVAFGVAAIGLLVIVVVGGDLGDAWDDVLPFAFAVAALLAFAGWSRDRRSRSGRVGEAERELAERESELRRERERRMRTERARQAEREWSRELRNQVVRLYRTSGSLGDANTVPELVLETAIRLVEAEKGLLLARGERDSDGRLGLVASRGFREDPGHSEVAQRFANRVMEADEIIREDDEGDLKGREEADSEIDNLIAIPLYIANDFHGIVVCANRPGGFEEIDDDVLLALGDHAGAALENRRLHSELRDSYLATVRMLADTIEAKDPDVRVHSDEVAGYVAAVADELARERQRRDQLVFASLLHDIGKVGISERILLKPDSLTDEERSLIELHPRIGSRLIDRVPALRGMSAAVLYHHERYDGAGYPAGLKGEEIPVEARILCVADCFTAMTSDRPHRDHMEVEDACSELERCAGSQFDPRIARLFVDEVRKQPPRRRDWRPTEAILDDPEIAARRHAEEPLLGYGTTEATDNLTHLYSHRYLHEVAAAEAERAAIQGTPFAVVMLRLEDLERVNVNLGFAAGDDALRSAGQALQAAALRCDGIASRYSGRCFAMVIPGAGEAQGRALCNEIVAEVEAQGRRTRSSVAVWVLGRSGRDVIAEARRDLDPRPLASA